MDDLLIVLFGCVNTQTGLQINSHKPVLVFCHGLLPSGFCDRWVQPTWPLSAYSQTAARDSFWRAVTSFAVSLDPFVEKAVSETRQQIGQLHVIQSHRR